MLSYSTYGSKESEMTLKIKEATRLIKERYPQLKVDGEIQLDVAVDSETAKIKGVENDVAGHCNTLVFPDLNCGNIGYKLVRNLAKAEAYGPICQGIAKPVNDLSRGCAVEDIVGVIAITAIQAKNDY
jgi:phosphate acetyltransferase